MFCVCVSVCLSVSLSHSLSLSLLRIVSEYLNYAHNGFVRDSLADMNSATLNRN